MLKNLTLWIAFFPLVLLLPSCNCSDQSIVRIGGRTWRVELADDEQARRRGLAGRLEVPEGTGMLFVFPCEEMVAFHMLDCLTGIDVAFISSDGTIVNIRTMTVEDDPHKPGRVYSSKHPARFALEVAAGTFERAGIKVGDKSELPVHLRFSR